MFKMLIFLSLIVGFGVEQDKLVKTKITDEVTVSLPQNFFPMSPQDLAQRYPSVRSPIGAYTNESRLVDFSVNISATQWRPHDVEIAKDFFKASIFNLYDRVNMLQEGIKTIDDKKFIAFEFESWINGEQLSLSKKDPVRRYSYIQYLIVRGKTLVFSFSCPIQLKEKWQPIVPEIMSSIDVKKSLYK